MIRRTYNTYRESLWVLLVWLCWLGFFGCAMKQPRKVVLVVPPECAKNVQVVGDCLLDANGRVISCPIRVLPTCTKIKEK